MEWNSVRQEILEIFKDKSEKLGINPDLEIEFIEDAPVLGEYVYGEAFPDINKVWLQIVAPDASDDKIMEIVCHELIHIKYTELDHNKPKFQKMVEQCKIM